MSGSSEAGAAYPADPDMQHVMVGSCPVSMRSVPFTRMMPDVKISVNSSPLGAFSVGHGAALTAQYPFAFSSAGSLTRSQMKLITNIRLVLMIVIPANVPLVV